jgi:hypothetical protein
MSTMPPPPPPVPSASPEVPEADKKSGWSKRKKWLVIAGAAVVVLAIGGALTGSDDDTDTVAASDDTRRTTTTVQRTTTTAEPTTTTTEIPPERLEVIERMAFAEVFDDTRISAAESLQGEFAVQSVDRFVFDSGTGTVIIEITSVYSTVEYQDDQAWEIMRALADLWMPPGGAFVVGDVFRPNLEVIVSGRSKSCSAEFMGQLATFAASRSDWETAC